MARLSYPAPGEPRPAALPPEQRTVGQLVGESIHAYGERFFPSLALGLGPALIVVGTVHVSGTVRLILAPTLVAPVVSVSLTAAAVIVLKHRPSWRRLTVAWACGWLVLVPAQFLVLAFVLPGLAWLAAVVLVVPVLVVEDLAPRAAFARAWQLARADYVHALGSLATLAIVVFLTQAVLAFLLRGAAGAAVWAAYVLGSLVVSPLLFLGTALLYVDQEARADATGRDRLRAAEPPSDGR